ncbi:hypothetical protein J6590_016047 [Homalodisca vitripennis]|nr:hypothetical protein J6590_016047 [Homalodisca vitripennis]
MLQANGDSYNIEDKDEASEALLSKPMGKPSVTSLTMANSHKQNNVYIFFSTAFWIILSILQYYTKTLWNILCPHRLSLIKLGWIE